MSGGRVTTRMPETVRLTLRGPKSLLRSRSAEALTVDASLNDTWDQVLVKEFGLKIQPDSGVFMCSSDYTPTAPKQGRGWRAELNEQILDYVGKFGKERKQYHVRIFSPNITMPYYMGKRNSTPINMTTGGKEGSSSTSGVTMSSVLESILGGGPSTGSIPVISSSSAAGDTPTPGTSGCQKQHPYYGTRFQKRKQPPMASRSGNESQSKKRCASGQPEKLEECIPQEPVSGGSNSEREIPPPIGRAVPVLAVVNVEIPVPEPEGQDDRNNSIYMDDTLSIGTTATEEEDELRREGLEVGDLKSVMMERLAEISNGDLLRLQNEVRERQRKGVWERSVVRTPLCCLFLEKLTKF